MYLILLPFLKMQAYAESSIQEMRSQLKFKEEKIKGLQAHLEMDRQTYLAQHSNDRKEIEDLTSKLLDERKNTINSLRVSNCFS